VGYDTLSIVTTRPVKPCDIIIAKIGINANYERIFSFRFLDI